MRYREYLTKLEQVAHRILDELSHHSMSVTAMKSKGELGNIVTNLDTCIERFIFQAIEHVFGSESYELLSEETKTQITASNYMNFKKLFVIDPIDGTTNLSRGLWPYMISIGLCEFGQVVAGVIIDPVHQDIYTVCMQGGVWKNGERISRAMVADLKKAVIGTSWGYGETPRENYELWENLIGKVASLRVCGSAVADLLWTATGQFTCYVHNGLKPWDTAVGLLMLQEMGVRVTNWDKAPLTLFDSHIVAAPPELFEPFYSLLFPRYGESKPSLD